MPISSLSRKPRIKWKNYVNDQQSDPLQYFSPTSAGELREIVLEAEANGYQVKAIGSGHSTTDIAISRDYMINTKGLNRVLDKSALYLKPEFKSDPNLYFVECGIVIQDLIDQLEQEGKALINMGAYTGQTLAGVISTSTHGSGITLGAFPAYVAAIILLGEAGQLYHIERSGPGSISTEHLFLEGFADIRFIQDDDYFRAVAVNMGCMGIIYAVVIRVTDSYWLEENRYFSSWEKVKKELQDGDLLTRNRHLEVLVNPYPDKNRQNLCLVTKRCIDPASKKRPIVNKGHRKIFFQLLLDIIPPGVFDVGMRFLVNRIPKWIPSMVRFLVSSLTDRNYVDKSFIVLDLGRANNLAAYATEISFPSSQYIAASDAIIALVEKSVRDGSQYLTAPFSLRFVKTNDIFLSMQYGEETNDFVCMIEYPTVSRTTGGMEILSRIESAMYAYGGKPHWGQVNHVGGEQVASLPSLYPRFNDWMKIYQSLCTKGTFQNDFTRRCGIKCR